MPQGLSVSRIVNVNVSFAPLAVPLVNFDTLLIMGDSDVIDTGEALREYNSILEVAGDFGTTAPEYLAASLFFGQSPQPATLFIGRWARTATKGTLVGGPLPGSEQLLTAWTGITTGSFRITVDGGAPQSLAGLNFSGITNMNAVATVVNAVLTGAVMSWDGFKFLIKSNSTGATSTLSYVTATGAGVDISTKLRLTAALATRDTGGIIAETPVAGVVRVDGRGWYAVMFAASVMPSDSDRLAISAYIEAASDPHLYGITTSAAAVLDPTITSDIASQEALADYMRTVIQYSLTNPYAIASFFGRAFTVNFEGSNTTITMKFKKEPGILPEILNATQASALAAKRCNVYAMYTNGAAIVQEGVMSGLAFFDEIHGTDWLANRVQTDIFNVLYQSPKIPQTNPGIHILLTTMEGAMSQGATNGLMAPGVWNAPGFGTLQDGDYLAKGWYSYAASVDTQPQSEREARKSPLLQAAIKLAGAVHSANVLINVNRAMIAAIGLGAAVNSFFGGMFT